MPFTPAHAIVALPFIRTPLVPGAVAIGAMMPDLPLYLRVGPDYWTTHSWWAVIPVDLPLALGLFLVWRVLLRPAVPELVPGWYARRLPDAWRDVSAGWRDTWGSSRRTLLLLLSLAIGVVTHLVWDAFTHEGRWGSALIPALNAELSGRPLWEWVALASSVLGLAGIGLWVQIWCARQIPRDVTYRTPTRVRVIAAALVPLSLLAAGVLVAVLRGDGNSSGWFLFLERVGTSGGAIALCALTLLAAGIRASLARHARDAS
ncbi:hypothetical protein HDC94_001692 [Leifsonia sp. AK011]|uniref:DUF4184 family protein n=1 Tax=Leifsonia sp. AK011 TaxID=2723075 RepID=UPI0015CE51CD|nr:DUF4184 family protein [Leifsonia sp. AK011]NYF10536.1 hypothetical protein [Leifsonia sp. AK011]